MLKWEKQNQQQQPPHCQSGKRLEMRKMNVLSDHQVFWALPHGQWKAWWLLISSSQRSSKIKGTNDSTTAECLTFFLRQRTNVGGARSQLVEGQCWTCFSWTSPWGFFQGRLSQRAREILKDSKAGLLSRIPAHSRMDPKLRKTNSIALSANTLPKKAAVDEDFHAFYHPDLNGPPLWESDFPTRLGALCDLEAIYVPVALWWLLWGCPTHHPQSMMPIPMATSPIWGPELHCIMGVQCAFFFLIQPPQTPFRNPIFTLFNCFLDPLPLSKWLVSRKALWYCFLSISPPSPQCCPWFLRALEELTIIPIFWLVDLSPL